MVVVVCFDDLVEFINLWKLCYNLLSVSSQFNQVQAVQHQKMMLALLDSKLDSKFEQLEVLNGECWDDDSSPA
ncbi:hypothetical protein CHUAL_001529 [Chamberlinius hualienensis]